MTEEIQDNLERPKEKKPKGYRFTGGNRFLNGIPAKDMTLREWRELPEDLRELALNIGLYEVIK